MYISLKDHENRITILERRVNDLQQSSSSSNSEFSKSSRGYYRDGRTGLMLVWEKIVGQGKKAFHKPFPNACLALFISPDWARRGAVYDNSGCGANIIDRTHYYVYIDAGASNNNYILAIGY